MKIVPDYLEGYLDLERLVLILIILACFGGTYYWYHLDSHREKLSSKVKKFASKAPRYQKLKLKLERTRPKKVRKTVDENPLSYLEKVIPNQYLTNLKPIKNNNNQFQFELKIQSTNVKSILDLLAKLEKERALRVTRFALIRETTDGKTFHTIMTLQIAG